MRWSLRVLLALFPLLLSAAAARGEELVALDTELGTITLRLLPDQAPRHVESFRKLVTTGFYDGTTFHRVIPGYIVQGGSPTSRDGDAKNDNFGGPDFTLKPEFNDIAHDRGVVSMARNVDNPDSAGSQFFIVLGRAPQLDQIRFTVFARVVAGLELLDRIAQAPRDVDNYDRPLDPVVVKKARLVSEATAAAVPPGTVAASAGGTAATAPATASGRNRVRTLTDLVNVRSGPGTDKPVLQKLRRGTVLPIVSRQGEWLGVELTGGATGYVRSDMVEPAP